VPCSTITQEITRTGIASAQHRHIQIGEATAGDERLAAIDAIMRIPLRHRPGLQRRRVGAGTRLGQAVAHELIGRDDPRQKPLALRLVAKPRDHGRDHVMDAEKRRRRRIGIRQLLEDQRRIQPRQAGAAMRLGHIQRREPECGRLAQFSRREMPLLGLLKRQLVLGEVEIHRPAAPVYFP
jgi:hypothetical protein